MPYKKIFIIGGVVLAVLFLAAAIYFYPILKTILHQNGQLEKMPSSFLVQFPLDIDEDDRFRIPCTINGNSVSLIVDTKATALMREEDIDKYKGEYFTTWPTFAENAYKEKSDIRMYCFEDFKINDLPFGQPTFTAKKRDNLIYDIIDEGVLGSNILSLCHWEFSVDEQTVSLYSQKDSTAITSSTKGYTQIPCGLQDEQIQLSLSGVNHRSSFTLDLGYNGEIEINNALADSLMKTEPFTTVEMLHANGAITRSHVFEHQQVVWNDIVINDCQVVNIPAVDGNYIGSDLMRRFNFILGYNDYYVDHMKQNHLYIQPTQGFDTMRSNSYLSHFDLILKNQAGSMIITSIVKEGIAEKQGLRLGEKVELIDAGAFHTTSECAKPFIDYTSHKDSITIQTQEAVYTLRK